MEKNRCLSLATANILREIQLTGSLKVEMFVKEKSNMGFIYSTVIL